MEKIETEADIIKELIKVDKLDVEKRRYILGHVLIKLKHCTDERVRSFLFYSRKEAEQNWERIVDRNLKIRLQKEEKRDDNKKERIKKYAERYRENHTDKAKEYAKKYYLAHRADLLGRANERYKKNKPIKDLY